MPPWLTPVTLAGRYVRLEPLSLAHVPALAEVAADPDVWRLLSTPLGSEEEVRAFVQGGIDMQAAGTALPFCTVDVSTNRPIGSTRFANADPLHRRVEIGWTWLGRDWMRTPANTEAKHLMLTHAFDVLGCVRVELKTDALNQRSRNAMLRIGATEEGTLRRHMLVQDGRYRDSVYFSILDDEWPAVRERLQEMLARPWPPP